MEKLKDCKNEDQFSIKYLNGTDEQKRHLQNLGFIPTSVINVINTNEDNMIVQVFDSRIAINSEVSDNVYGTILKIKKEKPKRLILFRKG